MRKTPLIAMLLSISFFAGCSVEKKEEPNSQQVIIVEKPPQKEVIIPLIPIPQPPIIIMVPAKEPKHIPQRVLTKKERFNGTLQAHNRVRAKHHLPPLKWSNRLANYSQQWANQLGRSSHCQMYHRSGSPPFGENLYRSSALIWNDGKREIAPINIKEVVKAWTDEERWYNYKTNRCQPGKKCGHYTQAVWKNTKEVGCAMKVCADKSQTWVCSYNPAGNYVGMKPY